MADIFRSILHIFIFFAALYTIKCANREKKSWGVADLEYCNPKYIVNCSVTTFKVKNKIGERSFMNITSTFTVPTGNNFTIGGTMETKPGVRVKFSHKFCDFFRLSGMVIIMRHQRHLQPFPCPFRGKFQVEKLELPPSKLPVPVKNAKYYIRLELSMTTTKESVAIVNIKGEFFRPK